MQEKIKTILFAAALNEYSQSYFSFSMNLATQLSARLLILHVIENFQATYEGIAAGIFGEIKWKEILQSHKQNEAQRFKNTDLNKQMVFSVFHEFCLCGERKLNAFKSIERKIIIRKGNIANVIIKQAKSHNSDLIIMGASRGYLAGESTSQHIKSVIKNSFIPVIVTPIPLSI